MTYARTANAPNVIAAPRGFARVMSAVNATFEIIYEVFAEATDGSSAARCRFPSAD